MPDLAASVLFNSIRAQAGQVQTLQTSLAGLDRALAKLESPQGGTGFAAAWELQRLQTERGQMAQQLDVAEPQLAQARARLMALADPSLSGATVLPAPQDLHARLQGQVERLEGFIAGAQSRLAEGGIEAVQKKINAKEEAVATSLLPVPAGFPPGPPTARLETEIAQLHRELHSLQQAQAALPAAQQELAQVRQRLQVAALCVQDARASAAPAPGAQHGGPTALATQRPKLGELLAAADRHDAEIQQAQRAQLVKAALPDGGAALRRLGDRAARMRPGSTVERMRARLQGPPRPMDGQRLKAFEGLVRADVMALAKTGRKEPRLAAEVMRKAVEEGLLGQAALPEDRLLLLRVLDQMARGNARPQA